jgi:multiple antibiotic resistance protein
MHTLVQATVGILAVVNPVVCSSILLQVTQNRTVRQRLMRAAEAMAIILAILVISALAGHRILKAFSISLDAFQVVGGIIIAYIGFVMLSGKSLVRPDASGGDLTPLIMFGASPGTIAFVITLSGTQGAEQLPLLALLGSVLAVSISLIVMAILVTVRKNTKAGGENMTTRFMGLVVAAMGLQFVLTGYKSFMALP